MAAFTFRLISPDSLNLKRDTLNLSAMDTYPSINSFSISQRGTFTSSSKFVNKSICSSPPFSSLSSSLSSSSRFGSLLRRSNSNSSMNSIVCESKIFEKMEKNENDVSNPSQKKMISGFTKNRNMKEFENNLPFASLNSSSSSPPPPPPPSSPYPGTPLMWVGLGVALTVTFSVVVKNVQARFQKFLMQKMFEQMQQGGGGMGGGPNPFGSAAPGTNPFGSGMPFPPPTSTPSPFSPPPSFPYPPPPFPSPPPSPSASTVKPAESTPPPSPSSSEKDVKASPSPSPSATKTRKSAFVDVNVEEIKQQQEATSAWQSSNAQTSTPNPEPNTQTYAEFKQAEVVTGSEPFSGYNNPNNGTGTKPKMSMEALEKLLEDPTIQKMIYPYLPEEMRDPTTFKWMIQNPLYRKQLEDMLNNMDGGQWDPRVFDMMKDFDMNSPDVQQQFETIGMKPEEVVAKIMANPDIAMAFQNPRLQAAIMDISANPMNVAKYYNDKEVMDIFTKLSALFPAAGGMPPPF